MGILRANVGWLGIAAALMAGCLQVAPQPPLPATSVSSWGPLGGFNMSSGALTCAGQITLSGGTATVSDPCFTGPDNIVLCTDTTAPNPVKCAPVSGSLLILGGESDTITYARLR